MALIDLITFSDGDDKYLELAGESWGRQLAIGTNWNRIRVGIMCHLVGDPGTTLLGALFMLGFSNGANQHALSQTASLWYGPALGSSAANYSGGSWAYNAGSGNPYFSISHTSTGFFRIVNGVITRSAGSSTSIVPTSTGLARRWLLFSEIARDGTAGKMGFASGATFSGFNQDYLRASFLDGMEQSGPLVDTCPPSRSASTSSPWPGS